MLYFIDIVIVDSIDSDCSILVAFFFFFSAWKIEWLDD